MIIDEIRKYSVYLGLAGFVIIAVTTRNIDYLISFLIGCVACNINLLLNEKLLDLSGGKGSARKNMTSFLLRMLVYVLALSLVFRIFNEYAMLLTFAGCLTVRIAILIIGIRKL